MEKLLMDPPKVQHGPILQSVYYFAYGSNMDLGQMARRCPGGMIEGRFWLDGWTLEFRGVADVRRSPGDKVAGVLWRIGSCEDWNALDRYEGFPSLYSRELVTVCAADGDQTLTAWVYVMTGSNSRGEDTIHGHPSLGYADSLISGYFQNGWCDNGVELAALVDELWPLKAQVVAADWAENVRTLGRPAPVASTYNQSGSKGKVKVAKKSTPKKGSATAYPNVPIQAWAPLWDSADYLTDYCECDYCGLWSEVTVQDVGSSDPALICNTCTKAVRSALIAEDVGRVRTAPVPATITQGGK
jgi:hypothetical protein